MIEQRLQFYSQMKKQTLAQRNSLIHSLKCISLDCEQLYFESAREIPWAAPCQSPQPGKTLPCLSFQPRCSSALAKRHTAIKIERPSSVLFRCSNSVFSEGVSSDICRKVYRSKIEESKFRENAKQEGLFLQKLAHSIAGNAANLTCYQIGPRCLKQLTHFLALQDIHELVLDKNPIGDEGIRELLGLLERLQLKKLSLGSIGMQQKGCEALLQSLSKTKTLQTLNLCSHEGSLRNRLRDGIKNIYPVLQAGVKRLDLSNTGLDDRNLQHLWEAMKKGCSLQALNLSQNEITEAGMEAFKRSVGRVELRELDLSKNKAAGGGFFEMGTLIGSEYNLTKISKTLKTLKLCHSHNNRNAFSFFCKEIERNQHLQQLHIDFLHTQTHHFPNDLATLLRRNWSLKKLSMRRCLQLGTDCKGLWSSLLENRGIETLVLSENNFEAASFKQLFECLAQNKTIHTLEARGCRMSDSDLAKSQQSFTKMQLKKLFLDHNFINNAGADIIQKMIYKNKRIEELTLKGNCLTSKRLQGLAKALSYNVHPDTNFQFELDHYHSLEQSNSSQKEVLLKAVSDLKQKEKTLRYRHLLHYVAKRELDNGLVQKQMKMENQEISKLLNTSANSQKALRLRLEAKMASSTLKQRSSDLGLSEGSELACSIEVVQKASKVQ